MPEDAKEAAALADAIVAGKGNDIGRVCIWPTERVRSGDWSPAQWYDPALAEIALGLETRPEFVRANNSSMTKPLAFGAEGRAARGAFVDAMDGDSDVVMIFGGVTTESRRTMSGKPERAVVPRDRNSRRHERVLGAGGRLMLANRYDTHSGLVTALYSEEASVGSGWMPANGESRNIEKGICAWWNSTPGRLLLLSRRSKKLTYPHWSATHLKSVPIPPPTALAGLTAAWEANRDKELLPMREGDRCLVRLALDEAAAAAIGEGPAVVADWRRRLAAEPTISGRMAPGPDEAAADTGASFDRSESVA